MTGGSMLYIDAICKGIDDLPEVDQQLRDQLWKRYAEEGIEQLSQELKVLDPDYYDKIDKRITNASSMRWRYAFNRTNLHGPAKGDGESSSFQHTENRIDQTREELYDRINQRVDQMMKDGLLDEAKRLYPTTGTECSEYGGLQGAIQLF